MAAENVPQVEYRSIPGFPGYRVGNDGTVWTCKNKHGKCTPNWRELCYWLSKRGYRRVLLQNCCVMAYKPVHHLVLELFVGPRPHGMETLHDNDVPHDNRLSNLRWGTSKENAQDRIKNGRLRRGEQQHLSKFTPDEVLEIRQLAAEGQTFVALAKRFGCSPPAIRYVASGKVWTHVGGPITTRNRARAGLDRMLTVFGETHRMAAWSRDPRCAVSYDALKRRLQRGWPAEAAITTPLGQPQPEASVATQL